MYMFVARACALFALEKIPSSRASGRGTFNFVKRHRRCPESWRHSTAGSLRQTVAVPVIHVVRLKKLCCAQSTFSLLKSVSDDNNQLTCALLKSSHILLMDWEL